MQLEGKVGLVTGGTKGIGAATAIELARRGMDVAIVGRHDDEEARGVKTKIESLRRRCLLVLADMGKPEDATRCVQETAEALGPPAVVVHCAGGVIVGGLLDVEPETWYRAFDVHVHAVYYLGRAAVLAMKERKEGAIITISSVAGIRGIPMNLCYQVVKGALPQFTRALARELADHNIRVNCIAPGIIRTAFHTAGADPGNPVAWEERRRAMNVETRVPLHREGSPEEIATMIAEVAANDYVTGETFTVDGGLTMRIA